MKFSYKKYKYDLLIKWIRLPLECIALLVFAICLKAWLFFSLLSIIFILTLIHCIKILKRYGVVFFKVREKDCVNAQGIIADIKIWKNITSFQDRLFNDYVLVTINDKDYTLFNNGDLNVGDNVFVKYLPQANIILEISKCA